MYQISDLINGKPSWRTNSHAIWHWSGFWFGIDSRQWVIGYLADIGTNFAGIYANDTHGGLDDDKNVWAYDNLDNGWMFVGANDFSIDCTSKTVEKNRTERLLT